LLEQRSALLHDFAELLPQMSDAVAWQAVNILEAAGVRIVRPDGLKFDPAHHHAVGTEQAPGHEAAGLIARTVRPGYADGERLVVHPRVVVFEDGAS
jgi:molecular chaperone GrpE (heat shock protein)